MSRLPLLSLAALVAIPWQHATLELYRAGVTEDADRVRIEFCVKPKEGVRAGMTTVGTPKYRRTWGRWIDGTVEGLGEDRTLFSSTDSGPACFSVLLPRDAAALELPMGRRTLELPLDALPAESTGQPESTTEVSEPWREEPQVVLGEQRSVEGASLPVPRDHIVGVRLRAKNAGAGTAREVVAWIEPGAGVFAAKDGATRVELGELAPGAETEFVYRCYADRSAAALSFQVTFEQRGGAAKATGSIVSFPLAPAAPASPPVSDADGDVAPSLSARPAALAVVIGVGAYAKAPGATHAAADAKTAARYFERALGIPAARVELLIDGQATLGQMQRVFGPDGWLARRATADSEIFVFFAGHGMAEPEKFSPYLLPADADPDYLRQTALSMDKLIEMLASLGARRTTLFLDACFAGLSREGGSLLDDARPLVIEQAPRVPAGLSIFSAGSGGQIVSALEGQAHGLFSYYLFKGLSGEADLDHDRRVLASELKSYLEDAVPRAAKALDREQTPGIALADPEQVMVQLP